MTSLLASLAFIPKILHIFWVKFRFIQRFLFFKESLIRIVVNDRFLFIWRSDKINQRISDIRG